MCSLTAAKAARCLFLPVLKQRRFQELSISLLDFSGEIGGMYIDGFMARHPGECVANDWESRMIDRCP